MADGLTRYDMRVEAKGLEEQLKELETISWKYQEKRREELLNRFDAAADTQVVLIDATSPTEPHLYVIFSDKTALQQVRFRHFMEDAERLTVGVERIEKLLRQEVEMLEAHLRQDCEAILNH